MAIFRRIFLVHTIIMAKDNFRKSKLKNFVRLWNTLFSRFFLAFISLARYSELFFFSSYLKICEKSANCKVALFSDWLIFTNTWNRWAKDDSAENPDHLVFKSSKKHGLHYVVQKSRNSKEFHLDEIQTAIRKKATYVENLMQTKERKYE